MVCVHLSHVGQNNLMVCVHLSHVGQNNIMVCAHLSHRGQNTVMVFCIPVPSSFGEYASFALYQ